MPPTDTLKVSLPPGARTSGTVCVPGVPPPCWSINAIVKEQKARLRGATQDELDRLRAEAAAHNRQRFDARVVLLPALARLVIMVPEDKDIAAGDDVIVSKKGRE